MIRSLKTPEDPYTIEVLPGISVMVRPVTTTDLSIAQAAARMVLDSLENSVSVCHEAGFLPKGIVLDLQDPAVREGLFQSLTIREIADRHIVAFVSGVCAEDGTTPMPCNSETRRAFADIFTVGEIFYRKITERQMDMLLAKEECGADACGTSSQAPAPDIAPDAAKADFPAPTESQA